MKKSSFILYGLVLVSNFLFSQTFTLKSDSVGGQATKQEVFNGFGCTGDNVSPQLYWQNAPKETQSFAVTLYDADAPTGSGWWHWLIFDVPASLTELKAGAGNLSKNLAPTGSVQSITDFGTLGYGGPCPPQNHGFHQYVFTVYALKTPKLGLDAQAMPALVGYYLEQNVIEKASIVMYFRR